MLFKLWYTKNMSRTHRRNRTGSAAVDRTCRNHGTYPWCEKNRTMFDVRQRMDADEKLKEFMNGPDAWNEAESAWEKRGW